MANKETRVLKQDTLEILRQKTNEISLHVGDNEQLDALLADKTYNYTAAAGQVLFDGADNNSKVARFELSPQHTVDNTGGSIILEGVSSIAGSYTAGASIYQGTSGSETYQATIVSATTNKIIVRDSTGTFSTSEDLKVGTSSPDTIANAKIVRIIIESYPVAIARVYNAGTELTQGISANGFYAPKIVATSTLSNSPSIGNAFSEGVTVYQNGTALNTQADIESSANWYGVLHSADSSDEIRFKTAQGSFSATAKLRVLGSSDEIAAADHGGLNAVDTTYGSYIELITPASGSAAIKIFSLDIVAAINELQDDIGTVENLTTSANDVVLAINEHDSELGTITALAMGTSASTVSTAIKEHEDQIGNVDITGISGSNDTITGALEQLHNEVGDVTSSNLGTSASNLTAAVKEHEDKIGNENITSIDSGSNTITGALNQLHTEVGSLSLNTSASDLTAAINEHEADIGNMTLTGLSASDLSAAVRELRAELGDHTTIDDAAGYSATTAVGGITELQGDVGDVDSLDTNSTSDVVAAINELENVLRDDTTQRTGYVMGTNANNVIAAINEIEEVLRGSNSNYTLNTSVQNVRDAINEHETQIGNLVFGAGGPVDVANSTVLTGAINVLDAEIGSASYTGADLTTAIKNTQDDILTAGSLTTLNTTNKFIQGAINEIEADLFNSGNAGSGGDRREMSDLKTADKTSILDAINEIYDDIHTSGSVTLGTSASHLVGAINEIEGVFDASTHEISAGTNAFNVTSGAFTIDSSGDIILDAGDADILLKDDGATYGSLNNSGTNLVIKSGTSTMLTGSGANATFANNLTVTNDLIVNNNVDIEGNVDVNGSIETDGLSINGITLTATATELNVMDGGTSATSTTLVDADRLIVNDNGTMKQVGLQDFETYFESALDTLSNVTTVGALNAGSITSGFGNINIGTSTITGGAITGTSFVIGSANISEAELETIDSVTAGTVSASKAVVVDSNKDITGFRNVTIGGNIDVDGTANLDTVDIDGTLDVALGSTLRGAVNITDATASSSTTTGALKVAGGVGIGEDLYVAGDLYVEGDKVQLDTQTLTVEDTLVLAGNNLSSEPASGGFGLEVGPITSPSGVASGVTGAHSIVYNFATDQWEADGSLILSQATLGSPDVKVNNGSSLGDLESSNTLDFLAGTGLSVSGAKVGNDYNITYTNTDLGSSQNIFKTVTINGTSSNDVIADSNSDTLNLRGLDAITLTSVPGTDTINIDHDNFGTAGTYGQTGTQDGKYIKSLITNDQGHVTAITTGDFDTRYQPTNPFWVLQEDGNQVDQVGNTDIVNFASGAGISISGAHSSGTSTITVAHADTSSVNNLSSDNTGNTFIQDINFTFDTFGHVTAATVGTGTVSIPTIGDGSFTVSGSSGLSGTGSMTANQTGNTTATLTNTDKGSSQNIFKNIAVTDTDSGFTYAETGTVVADSNNDTVTFVSGGAIDIDVDAGNDVIRIAHSDTSSQASVNNSGRTYIQDITLDTYGHVTGIGVATETYVFTPPTYDGDDINIDTGALTGATVISDLDLNVTTNTFGHVTDANATVATRNLTLSDLGFVGWDVEVNGVHKLDVGNNVDVDFKNGNHTTATWTPTGNRIQFDHNTFSSGGTYTGGSDNGIVIEGFHIDSFGHIRNVQTRDLDSRFDNYGSWLLTADSGGTATISSGDTVDVQGGTHISTVRSGDNVTINFVDPGYLTTQRAATFDAIQNSGSNSNPFLSMTDAAAHNVELRGGNNVTVTRVNDHRIDIAATNTDVDVSVANLRTRLGQISTNTTIGDASDVDITFSGDVIVDGNLTISGSTTTVNTETVTIQDNIILLNSNSAGNPTENAGLEVERGNSPNVDLIYNEGTDRWQFTNNGTAFHNIPLSTEYMDKFKVEVDDGGNVDITDNEILGLRGGTAIETDFVTTVSGDSHTLQVKHSNVTRSDPSAGSSTLAYAGTFSAVTGVTSNNQGHITAVNTSQFTMPSQYSLPVATKTDLGGVKLFNDTDVTESDVNAVSTTASRWYGVQLTENDRMVVNVPWANTEYTVQDGELSQKNFTTALKNKLDGIEASANAYVLPLAANGTRGGVQIGYSENGKNYPVELSSEKMYVNVPWTNTTYTAGTGLTLSGTVFNANVDGTNSVAANASSVTANRTYKVQVDSGDNLVVNVPWTDENEIYTFDAVGLGGSNNNPYLKLDGSTTNPQYVQIQGGNNTTVTRLNDAAIKIDVDLGTDANTFLNDVATVDNGANMILRHTMNSGTSHDVGITAGSNITLTPGTETFEIAATNTTYSAGTGLTLSGTSFSVNSNQAGNIDRIGPSGSDNCLILLEDGGGDVEDNQLHMLVGGTALSNRVFTLDGNGKALFKNDVVAFSTSVSSDRKLKENIKTVDNPIEKVMALSGVTFNWRKDGKASAGVIAQDVEEVLPSAVKDVREVDSEDTYKHVDYNQLSALFIEAIKELKHENELLKAEIESLKDINS